jgi:hypothetical protein
MIMMMFYRICMSLALLTLFVNSTLNFNINKQATVRNDALLAFDLAFSQPWQTALNNISIYKGKLVTKRIVDESQQLYLNFLRKMKLIAFDKNLSKNEKSFKFLSIYDDVLEQFDLNSNNKKIMVKSLLEMLGKLIRISLNDQAFRADISFRG